MFLIVSLDTINIMDFYAKILLRYGFIDFIALLFIKLKKFQQPNA